MMDFRGRGGCPGRANFGPTGDWTTYAAAPDRHETTPDRMPWASAVPVTDAVPGTLDRAFQVPVMVDLANLENQIAHPVVAAPIMQALPDGAYTRRYQDQGNPPGWPRAPRLIEDVYSVVDAVVVGNLLISLLRHSDRVTVACQARPVNVIAPIMTEPDGSAWRQTTFYPFAQASRYARGNVLQLQPTGPRLDTKRFGDVPAVDAVATHDPETGQTALFAVNRSQQHPIRLDIDTRSLGAVQVVSCHQLQDDDPTAHNTADNPDRVKPRATQDHSTDDGTITVVLPPVSWTVLRLAHNHP